MLKTVVAERAQHINVVLPTSYSPWRVSEARVERGRRRRRSKPYQTGWGLTLGVGGWLFYFVVLVVAADAVKTQRELDRARIDTLEHTEQLEREILWTSEQEQQRIGRDLHDSLGPQLAAIGY